MEKGGAERRRQTERLELGGRCQVSILYHIIFLPLLAILIIDKLVKCAYIPGTFTKLEEQQTMKNNMKIHTLLHS